ncbi:hypothetical protein C5167_049213 [Papaver somniferum]|uniref:DUF4283 domain-containing protein n=1 Tax=Papaver somniferum TaxID=3469 RepID=A0A4Y7KK65_PAPSO|nr:hypothetical protein C5167_049213 [Papaver somniferum]
MSSTNNNHINQLSRQLRRDNIGLPVNRRTVGSSQVVNHAAEECIFGVLGKLMRKEKIHMKTIRKEINSLWRNYRNKQIQVMGHNLMMVCLNSEEERDEVIRNGSWIIGEALFVVKEMSSDN